MTTPSPFASTAHPSSHPLEAGSVLACFDSGLGGVVFLNHVLRQWPDCPLVFVGDTAWIPYGDKAPEAICHRVDSIYRWLLRAYPEQIGAFVLACNTSVGAAMERLQTTQHELAASHALLHPVSATINALNPTHKRIGILATAATIQAQTYQKAILTAYPNADVTAIACPGWVDLIETGQHLNENHVLPLIQPVCDTLNAAQVDVVILGCTHYGLLSPWLTPLLGTGVTLLDSAECLAKTVVETYQPQLALSQPALTPRLLCTRDACGFNQRIAQFGFSTLSDVIIEMLSDDQLRQERIESLLGH